MSSLSSLRLKLGFHLTMHFHNYLKSPVIVRMPLQNSTVDQSYRYVEEIKEEGEDLMNGSHLLHKNEMHLKKYESRSATVTLTEVNEIPKNSDQPSMEPIETKDSFILSHNR